MTHVTRPQSNPGHNYVSKPSGGFPLPLEASSMCGKFFNLIFQDEIGLIDIIDLRMLSRDRNKVNMVLFNDTGDAFATVDTAGHIVVFYIAKDKFISVCRAVHPTALLLTEKYHGMLFLGMEDSSIHVYNLGISRIFFKCLNSFSIAGKLVKQLKSHKHPIKEFFINSSRDLALSQSDDTCVLWNLSTLKTLKY